MDRMKAKTAKLRQPTIAILYFLVLITCAAIEVNSQSGTTIGIKDIFANRCNTFQQKHHLGKNCARLWELFLNSFANKLPCAVTPESYSQFFLEANHTASIADKSLFWAFTGPFVYHFSDSQHGKYVTILDMLAGYTLNDLHWCWSMEKRDLDYVSCPSYKDCTGENEAVRSFWKANSQIFAKLSTGVVYAMLNGSVSTGGAFTDRSLFYTVEVPAMKYPNIKEMHVILVHDPLITFEEECFNGTLNHLKNELTRKNINYICEKDPPEVRSLQCSLHPEYRNSNYCMTSGEPSSHRQALLLRKTMIIYCIIGVLLSPQLKTIF